MWSAKKAQQWYTKQGWLIGANFIPSTASNQLEMWQAETFDPLTIETELGFAKKIGFNTVRVFLHNLLWEEDSENFLGRVHQYLEIADQHGLKTIFVLLDGVGQPAPALGPQSAPIPFVHNSRWVQSPSLDYLRDKTKHELIENYIKGVIKEFADDPRVVMWDIYNEPNNINFSYLAAALYRKSQLAYELLVKSFQWAREAQPAQPLTSAVWESTGIIGSAQAKLFNQFMLSNSDIVSFHSYEKPAQLEKRILKLQQTGRPVICTEYMARPNSTFIACLPVLKKYKVGSFNWGLVSGKTQTIYPWTSWIWRTRREPKLWFHDIFWPDGQPFDSNEISFIKNLISKKDQ